MRAALLSAPFRRLIPPSLADGGAGTTVNLCPNAQINLETSIYFYAANQTLQTGGLPFDSTRAVLTITDSGTTCAIYGADDGNDGVTLKNIIVNGNRDGLGWAPNGLALIEMGGNNRGQVIQNVKSYDPRGWSALHLIEGYQNSCSGSKILNNELGPSGHAPSGAQQFRMVKMKRETGTYPPGQWADGLSLACKNSIATGNTCVQVLAFRLLNLSLTCTFLQHYRRYRRWHRYLRRARLDCQGQHYHRRPAPTAWRY